ETGVAMAKRTIGTTHEDFDPRSLDVIRADILSALKAVTEKHGVTFGFGNTNYSPGSFSVRLEAKSDGGEKRDFEEYALGCGLKPSDFGAVFTYKKTKYTVSGIKPRSGTYPIVATREDGQKFNFSADTVIEALNAGRSNGN